MTTNPVYKREMMVSSRSIRLPLIVAGFNLILAAFTLVYMFVTVNMSRVNAQINYATFLNIFKYVTIIEFALMLFTTPALTAGSISTEREHRTLELMLTTKLTPAKIVIGKLEASLSSVAILFISSLPILALVFAYGGITVISLVCILISFLCVMFFAASLGIYASSISKRTSMATAAAYAIELVFIGGTVGIPVLIFNITGSAGNWIFLLLANPVATFYSIISFVTGNKNALIELASMLGTTTRGVGALKFFIIGTILQLIIGMIFLMLSIRHVDTKVVKKHRKG